MAVLFLSISKHIFSLRKTKKYFTDLNGLDFKDGLTQSKWTFNVYSKGKGQATDLLTIYISAVYSRSIFS